MAASPKPVSTLAELKIFVENHKATPYPELLKAAAEAGWETLIQEIEATGQVDGTTLVRFSVAVGRDGKFEPYDTVTVKTGAGPGPVSIAARLLLPQSLIFLFFGRLPEQPQQTVNVEQQPEGDIVLPGEKPLEPEVPEQEYVPRRQAAAEDRLPDLVDHLEPDGVPVFIDLDTVPEKFSADGIIARLLEDMDKAALKFAAGEQVLALFTKNTPAVEFLKELGTPDDRKALAELLDKHKARIEDNARVREVKIPSPGPRRRKAA